MHTQAVLSHADTMTIVDAIRAELERLGKGAAIAVADEHGELLAFLRTDGCKLSSVNVAINKAFTAARDLRDSKAVGDAMRDEQFPMTNFGDPRYTAWGGGVVVEHEGQIVGAVGVSGLSEQEDIDLSRLGIRALQGR